MTAIVAKRKNNLLHLGYQNSETKILNVWSQGNRGRGMGRPSNPFALLLEGWVMDGEFPIVGHTLKYSAWPSEHVLSFFFNLFLIFT